MRPLLVIAALGTALALGGCATTAVVHPTADPSGATARSVCSDAGAITSLVIHRTAINPERFGFPSTVTDTNPASAQAVAAAACRLPASPSGVFSCPNAYGPTYRLAFYAKGSEVGVDVVAPTGCASVTVGAGTRSASGRAPDATFWSTLGGAVGVPAATQQTFVGTLT
jgi:hypothetical protein